MALGKAERTIIKNTIARLRRETCTSERVEEALESSRLWLETWVIPPLEVLLKEKRGYFDLEDAVKMSASVRKDSEYGRILIRLKKRGA